MRIESSGGITFRYLRVDVLVAEGLGCTVVPESALATRPDMAKLPRAAIGPPAIWNALVLATPLTRPGTRLTRETARLIRQIDFGKGLPH
jgi:LysR family nitrogen assimilation transcriptional regulator